MALVGFIASSPDIAAFVAHSDASLDYNAARLTKRVVNDDVMLGEGAEQNRAEQMLCRTEQLWRTPCLHCSSPSYMFYVPYAPHATGLCLTPYATGYWLAAAPRRREAFNITYAFVTGLTPNADCPRHGRGNGLYKAPNNVSVLLHHIKNPHWLPYGV